MPSGGGEGTYDEYFGQIPPESTEFGWPLYITVPLAYTEGNYRRYEKQPSDIVLQLYNWIMENYEEEQGFMGVTCYSYPPELYINGEKVDHCLWDVLLGQVQSDPSFYTSKISDGFINEDGSLLVNVYIV